MPTNLKMTENFHKNRKIIPKVILKQTDDNEIIYGARALNKRFPPFLDRPTQDYDIFSSTPKRDAIEVEKALDKRFGGNYFETKPAQHKGTWKVKSRVDGEGYADYTKPENKIPYDKIGGKNYIQLGYVKNHIKKTLKDPEAAYRHAKDKDALNRIMIYEKLKGKGGKTIRKRRNLWQVFSKRMRRIK